MFGGLEVWFATSWHPQFYILHFTFYIRSSVFRTMTPRRVCATRHLRLAGWEYYTKISPAQTTGDAEGFLTG